MLLVIFLLSVLTVIVATGSYFILQFYREKEEYARLFTKQQGASQYLKARVTHLETRLSTFHENNKSSTVGVTYKPASEKVRAFMEGDHGVQYFLNSLVAMGCSRYKEGIMRLRKQILVYIRDNYEPGAGGMSCDDAKYLFLVSKKRLLKVFEHEDTADRIVHVLQKLWFHTVDLMCDHGEERVDVDVLKRFIKDLFRSMCAEHEKQQSSF